MGFRRSQVQILSPRQPKALRSNELRKAFFFGVAAEINFPAGAAVAKFHSVVGSESLSAIRFPACRQMPIPRDKFLVLKDFLDQHVEFGCDFSGPNFEKSTFLFFFIPFPFPFPLRA
jgi:hypothetical protein